MPDSGEPAHYLPIRLKSKSSSLILRITSSPNTFPITIAATDGSLPFSAKLSKKDVREGKSGSFDGTDEEWEKIVMDALFSTSAQDDITLSASLNKQKDKITVTVQRVDEEDFTIRLGTLEIAEDEDAEVDLVEWLTESAQATITAKTESRKLKETTSSEQDMIEKLQAQLDELVKAKEDYETLLITKFNMLLNEKKAKIRELTKNGPVPEARIPESIEEDEKEENEEPAPKKSKATTAKSKAAVASKAKTTTTRGKAATSRKTASPPGKRTAATSKGKRKRTPTPEQEEEEMEEDDANDGGNGDGAGDETEDDGSVQGDEQRDADVERTFGVRDDEGDVTEDEEL